MDTFSLPHCLTLNIESSVIQQHAAISRLAVSLYLDQDHSEYIVKKI